MQSNVYTKADAQRAAEDLKHIFRSAIPTRPDTLEQQCRDLYEQVLDRDDTIIELRHENERLAKINRRLAIQRDAVREIIAIG